MSEATATQALTVTIDGCKVEVARETTLYDAAQQVGIDIPILCHSPHLQPVAVCRVCVVEVEGARVLQASCIRQVEDGMVVHTQSDKVKRSRAILVELLMSDYAKQPQIAHAQTGKTDQLLSLAQQENITAARFPARPFDNGRDLSSSVILVDHNACILCDRCIRACNDVQNNEVIGRAGKGYTARIAFDNDLPMGESTCVSCGECMAACPTGALIDKPLTLPVTRDQPLKQVDSLCPYCGVGCSITYTVNTDNNTIVQVAGRESPVNHGRLCVKGRYGFDYAHHQERLTVPLLRKADYYPKTVDALDNPLDAFREATWDEVLDLAAQRFMAIKQQFGSQALAGFGSAKCSNEDNYLFQKLIRAVFGTNNVDHCTRLCHASSVAALMEQIGGASVSNPFSDCLQTDAILIIGSNTTHNHPVAATFMKQAAKAGTTLIVADPRRPEIADHADYYVRFNPGTDVAFLNGLMHVILQEGLYDEQFIEQRTEAFDRLRDTVMAYPPRVVSRITGLPERVIIDVARAYGQAERAMIFWGMGISQHTTGTDNTRCLINLALMTGNIGRPGTGLHPLRGQNNVQGASDVGLIPMVYTSYQSVTDPAVREKFERAWGVELDPEPGLTVVEIMSEVLEGNIKAMFMMGENPFLSDPNINKVKKALAKMDFLVVQDIFLTETAAYADVILPATTFAEKTGTYTNTDSRVQMARKAIDSPGQVRVDWHIIADLASRMGYPMSYASEEEIWQEIVSLTPVFRGITYDRLQHEGIPWPCPEPHHPGIPIRFTEDFPRGKAKFSPAEFAPAKELPDDTYPFVLNTGRVLQHWHTGTMTRRAKALDEMVPEARLEMTLDDMQAIGIADGERVRVVSRRGELTVKVLQSHKPSRGSVFLPFHFRESAANLLTIDELDPDGKIPAFKFCAVQVEKIGG
ncbi:MAG: formate dehydrogenase subunit alpha [bacterium]|nr:formate dehydrogenase subunit alpha [bacterium]